MSGTSILVYAERVGGNLGEIEKLLAGPLADFDGIHVLPFFHPYDGDDAGFDARCDADACRSRGHRASVDATPGSAGAETTGVPSRAPAG